MYAWCLALAIVLGGLVIQPVLAAPGDHRDDTGEHQRGHREPGRMSPSHAARLAQQAHGGGRVLAVDPADSGYRVKLLQRGEVQIVFIPAE